MSLRVKVHDAGLEFRAVFDVSWCPCLCHLRRLSRLNKLKAVFIELVEIIASIANFVGSDTLTLLASSENKYHVRRTHQGEVFHDGILELLLLVRRIGVIESRNSISIHDIKVLKCFVHTEGEGCHCISRLSDDSRWLVKFFCHHTILGVLKDRHELAIVVE